jgi:hypothetical protein
VNDELERMWKGTVVAKFKELYRNFLQGLKKIMKTSVRIACLRAEI